MLCKAGGKEFKHWFENKTTKLLIYTSESEVGIPTSQLIDIKKGNSSKFEQGSWIHPDLGIHLAQWISPSFALQGSSITIPMREDGYINATMLCKAGGKRLDNYIRSSKEFIEVLKNSFPQIEGMELITSKIGGNHTGTWVHRKIGYHLAQ